MECDQPQQNIGNGYCDETANKFECNYDGGDCSGTTPDDSCCLYMYGTLWEINVITAIGTVLITSNGQSTPAPWPVRLETGYKDSTISS